MCIYDFLRHSRRNDKPNYMLHKTNYVSINKNVYSDENACFPNCLVSLSHQRTYKRDSGDQIMRYKPLFLTS